MAVVLSRRYMDRQEGRAGTMKEQENIKKELANIRSVLDHLSSLLNYSRRLLLSQHVGSTTGSVGHG